VQDAKSRNLEVSEGSAKPVIQPSPGSFAWYPGSSSRGVAVRVLGAILLVTMVGACSRPDRVGSFPEKLWQTVKKETEAVRRGMLDRGYDPGPVDRVVAWERWKQYHLIVARGPKMYYGMELEEQPDGRLAVDLFGGVPVLDAGEVLEWGLARVGDDGPAILVAYVARHVHTVEVLFRGRAIRKETEGRSAVIIFLEDEPSPTDQPLLVTAVRALNAEGQVLENQPGIRVRRRAP